MRAARAELSARASLLILHMQPAPRRVCLAEGSNVLDRGDGAAAILNISRDHFAPEAADAIRRQVMRFTRFCRADQSIAEYIAEYDLRRRQAGSEMEMGGWFPGVQCTTRKGIHIDIARAQRGPISPRKVPGGGELPQKSAA